ncbi:MAG: hypothetical protein AAF632_14915 [Bacteroidota bacterium]
MPDNYGEAEVNGFGLEVLYKYTLRLSERDSSKFYLSFGVGYHRITLDYTNYEPASFAEDGEILFRYDFVDQREIVNCLEAIGLIGMKIFSRYNILFFDFFVEPVIKKIWISTESVAPLSHSRCGNHGFNGVTYRIGAEVGVVIFNGFPPFTLFTPVRFLTDYEHFFSAKIAFKDYSERWQVVCSTKFEIIYSEGIGA